MQNDAAILAGLSGTILFFVLFTVLASKHQWIPQWLCRKILHLGAVGACAVAPIILVDLFALKLIVAALIPILFFLVKMDLIFPGSSSEKTYGIPLFALSFLMLLLIIPEKRMIIFFSMAVLAICDALAATAGTLYPRGIYNLTGDKKTITGSISFFIAFILLSGFLRLIFPERLPQLREEIFWLAIPLFAAFLTLVEAMGRRGWDNFFIPLISAALLLRLDDQTSGELLVWNYTAFAAVIFCVVTTRLKFLTLSGSILAGLIGGWIVIIAHYYFLFPLMFYFISSVLIVKIIKRKSKASDEKNGKPRDWIQVWSNGGLYAILMIGFDTMNKPWEIAGFCFISAIPVCVAVSDTWASEIGSRFNGKVIDIFGFKPVPAGISGGISLIGTVSGLAGATIFSAMFMYTNPLIGTFDTWWWHFTILAAIGFTGMLIDSILGSLFQAKYLDENGNLTDKAAEGAVLVSGYKWMNNDVVNQLSILMTLIPGLCFFEYSLR